MNSSEVTCKEELLNHNERCSAETSVLNSLSPSSSSTEDIFGNPEVHPRLGDEYQVPIPSLISKSEPFHQQNTLNDNADTMDFNLCHGEGLSIPIMWNHHVADHSEHPNKESLDSLNGYDHQGSTLRAEISENRYVHVYVPLPGSPVIKWSGDESETFLLGLYIFGKNLVQVQRFVESKKMGDVLSFYYGEFYRSDAHHRWVECRKMRTRRCILGPRILTGWRQQEILSRLLPSRSKEVQDTLIEATGTFNDGSASLEDFIFTLKALVGTAALVQAIGIGKGKQDLTGVILDHVKPNSSASARPEIPVGKACSSLTSSEIVRFLTGDFRLSKAKSNDLFWEAVWPRLLARGWHSEQPKDISSFTSKNSLVFLIPGIKKFSRKKLTKGNHYFDSVSDVLNKVASDPMLLELEVEEAKESGRVDDCHVDGNGLSDHKRPCYLRPRNDSSSELMKFTVVDTSLSQGGMPSKMRELRSLPDDATSRYRHYNRNGETNNSESSTEQSSSSCPGNTYAKGGEESEQSQYDDQKTRNSSKTNISMKGIQYIQSEPLVTDSIQTLPINGHLQFNKVKSEEQNSLAPVPKRPKLNVCKSLKIVNRSYSIPRNSEVKKEDVQIPAEISNAVEEINERPQPRTLIDLNVQPQEFDTEEPSEMEAKDELEPKPFLDTEQHIHESQSVENNVKNVSGEQPAMNSRRQSTRNRPPTTKALEALACGFLSVKKGRSPKSSRPPRSSRRSYKNFEASLPASDTDLSTSHITPTPSIGMDEFPSVGMDDYFRTTGNTTTGNASFYDNSHAQSEMKETHGLFGVL